MKITVTCGGKFHSDHLAAALLLRNALCRVVTAHPPRAYRRYTFPPQYISFTPPVYLPGWLAGKVAGLSRLEKMLNRWASRTFDQMAAKRLGQAEVVIAWAWSARKTFEAAKARGIRCILEECGTANAYQEALLQEEYDRQHLLRTNVLHPIVIENEKAECELADGILCPSEYVARSFEVYGIPRRKCLVIPYASNPKLFARPKIWDESIFRILYVGSVGVRKGILYLLQALALLPRRKFHCTVIGHIEHGFTNKLAEYEGFFEHIDRVPHEQLPAYYQKASVFVLPTLDEGMAYVVTEALCSGTPVITTPHSGAEGTIINGENGFLVPIRDPQAIAQALTRLMDHPEQRRAMGIRASQSAASYTWDEYVVKLLEGLAGFGRDN
jgi:glycosyltransferase involved in cell wall biosynthesis